METRGLGGERRRGPRVPLSGELTIFVESMGQFLERHGRDISEGGMFLESPAPPPPGTRLRFLIRPVSGPGLIRGLAEVAWRRKEAGGPEHPSGMGLRFLSMNPEGQALIRRMVAKRAAMTGETSRPDVHGAEPFPIEGEPVPPAPTPAEDVFEETSPKEEPARSPDAAPKALPADESTLLDITLPEIGRPYGYDEQRRPPRHWRGRVVAATAVVVIGVLGALGAWYAGWLDAPRETASAPLAPSEIEQRPLRSCTETPVSVAPRRQGGGPATGAVRQPSPTASPMPTATATPAPSPTPTIAPPPLAPAARTIRTIRWAATTSGTIVSIVPSGVLTTRRVRVILLDDPPRALVRIRGIRVPYPQPVIQAGSPELARMRIWLHSELRPPELYVVLDLARPGVRVRTRLRHGTVIVTLTRPRAR